MRNSQKQIAIKFQSKLYNYYKTFQMIEVRNSEK